MKTFKKSAALGVQIFLVSSLVLVLSGCNDNKKNARSGNVVARQTQPSEPPKQTPPPKAPEVDEDSNDANGDKQAPRSPRILPQQKQPPGNGNNSKQNQGDEDQNDTPPDQDNGADEDSEKQPPQAPIPPKDQTLPKKDKEQLAPAPIESMFIPTPADGSQYSGTFKDGIRESIEQHIAQLPANLQRGHRLAAMAVVDAQLITNDKTNEVELNIKMARTNSEQPQLIKFGNIMHAHGPTPLYLTSEKPAGGNQLSATLLCLDRSQKTCFQQVVKVDIPSRQGLVNLFLIFRNTSAYVKFRYEQKHGATNFNLIQNVLLNTDLEKQNELSLARIRVDSAEVVGGLTQIRVGMLGHSGELIVGRGELVKPVPGSTFVHSKMNQSTEVFGLDQLLPHRSLKYNWHSTISDMTIVQNNERGMVGVALTVDEKDILLQLHRYPREVISPKQMWQGLNHQPVHPN